MCSVLMLGLQTVHLVLQGYILSHFKLNHDHFPMNLLKIPLIYHTAHTCVNTVGPQWTAQTLEFNGSEEGGERGARSRANGLCGERLLDGRT